MKNQLHTLTISTVLLTPMLLSGCATTGNPTDIENICTMFRDNPDWKEATYKTQGKWGVPVQVQMAIIYQESSFRHDAKPGRASFLGIPLWRKSSAYGFAQVKDGTWDWYKDKSGSRFASRDNFADASDFIGWYADVSQRTQGISKWDARNQYLAYHEGHGGYKRKSYLKKPWLVKVAAKVKAKASTYGTQLKKCSGSSSSGWSLWPF